MMNRRQILCAAVAGAAIAARVPNVRAATYDLLIKGDKSHDVPLQPEDILFVPTSLRKDVALKTLEAMAGSATSVIYRIP